MATQLGRTYRHKGSGLTGTAIRHAVFNTGKRQVLLATEGGTEEFVDEADLEDTGARVAALDHEQVKETRKQDAALKAKATNE